MIKSDRGDDRDFRSADHVRGVKLAAKPHLKNYDIAVFLLIIKHTGSGDEFKLRGQILHGFRYRLDHIDQFRKLLIAYLLSVYLYPLIEAIDVR